MPTLKRKNEDGTWEVVSDSPPFRIPVRVQKYTEYEGATEITPTASDQVLATNKKSLESDITVKKVPTYETRNDAGGYTFVILSQGD